MRHESERVKGKNYRLLGGRPLFHHIVSTLLGVSEIDEVVIDTDSPLIAADARRTFPAVRVIPRPAGLLGGDVPMNEILLHDVSVVSADVYVQTHTTNPFLSGSTVALALTAFLGARGEHDSLFTVTPMYCRLWTQAGAPLNHDPDVLVRTQDLPPVMEENSCLYVFTSSTLKARRNRIGRRPLLYPIARQEAVDIDDEHDWDVAAAMVDAGQAPR